MAQQQLSRLKIDDLNILNSKEPEKKKRAIPYAQYFGEMDLTDEEKDIRIALAEALEEAFLFLFVVLGIEMALDNDIDTEYYYDLASRKYLEALNSQGIDTDEYPELKIYSDEICKDIVNATVPEDSKQADAYLTSEDRAMFIAENESNAIRNYLQLENAIKAGYTKKKWVTKHDSKVRHTHVLVDGETIGIYDSFWVGNSEMMFPKDTTLGAEAKEIVGCRCVCKYLK